MNFRSSLQQRPAITAAIVAFPLILGVKWPTISQLPIWDTAMGMFPAAIYLSETRFDLFALFYEPPYLLGGPNCHAVSLVTWATALGYMILGSGPHLFVILHLLHYLIAAFTIAGLFSFSRALLGDPLAGLLCLATLFFPVFLTQTGYLYIETPLALFTVFALSSWVRNRIRAAVIFSALACLTKESGVIVGGALAIASLLEMRPRKEKAVSIAAFLLPPFLLSAVTFFMSRDFLSAPASQGFFWSFKVDMWHWLAMVPDLRAALLLCLGIGAIRAWWIVQSLRSNAVPEGAEMGAEALAARSRVAAYLIVLAFFAFFLMFPLMSIPTPVLPRYYVQILPFVFFGLLDPVHVVLRKQATMLLPIAALSFFLLNYRGTFYPEIGKNDFALAERSAEYRDLYKLQREAIGAIQELPSGAPVIYGLPEHYLFHYPKTGYVSERALNGHCALFDYPYSTAKLWLMPPEFYVVKNYRWLGGERIYSLIDQATKNPLWSVEITRDLRCEPFSIQIVRVWKSVDL